MPIFKLNKLVRDKLKDEYARLNEVATYRTLSGAEHAEALRKKIIEEANELPLTAAQDEIVGELADIQQVIDDLARHFSIPVEQIQSIKDKKFDKKGGFKGATFVETLELVEGDSWVEYYRASPDVFREIGIDGDEHFFTPTLAPGTYRHYKGNLYEVIGVSLDTETHESSVVYRPLYESTVPLWTRPYDMFVSTVDVDGIIVPRFKKVEQ